jgi:hypothetical protein
MYKRCVESEILICVKFKNNLQNTYRKSLL